MLTWFPREMPPAPPAESPTTKSRDMQNEGSIPVPLNPQPSLSQSVPNGPPAEEAEEILRQQLVEVLNNLQEAQKKKDISLYMKSFVSSFPGLEKKRRKALAIWKVYDYNALQYDLENVTSVDSNTAMALVRWNLETRKRANQIDEKFTQSYKVWFTRTKEGWCIKDLEELSSP